MKNVKLKIIVFSMVFVFLFLFAEKILAANHYVRQGASGNGSDWANAYGSLPATLTRGDAYYIADGIYSGYRFDDPVSGTLLITIKKATVPDHGADTGWQSSYGDGQAQWNGQLAFESSYYMFDGVTGGGPGSWDSGFGFKITETESGTALVDIARSSAVNNITFQHIDMQGKGSAGGGGSLGNDAFALVWNGASDITIRYVYTHGIGRCPFWVPSSGANLLVEYSHIDSFYGSDGGHSEIASITAAGNMTFRYNLFTWVTSTGGIMWDNSANHNYQLNVYGNIFYRPAGAAWANDANGVLGGWTGGSGEDCYNMKIYNNSFINIPGSRVFTDFITRSGNNAAYNNLFYNSVSPSYANIQTHDYNYYINSGGSHSEANVTSAASGDPFVDYPNLNFSLKTAFAAGQTLSFPYNIDPLGKVRGADGVWDRGAYEYVSGTTPPPTAKIGDFNSDSKVDIIDLGIFLSNWGSTTRPASDLNQDGKVDIIDLGILLSNWG